MFGLWYSTFRNQNIKHYIFKLFSTKSNLPAITENVRKCLNHLMNKYQNRNNEKGYISEILELHNVQLLLNKKMKLVENVKSLNELVNGDKELYESIKKEELMYEQQLVNIDQEILFNILDQVTTERYNNVIMEIIPGIGGQEAMLFVKDLLNMYTSYLDYLGFTYEIIELQESETSGLRKATLLVSDSRAFEKLKCEAGVHRVQRVPITERSGRLHTSTSAVIILPEPMDIDIKLDKKDLKVESKKASGAGGQHVNTTNSAIRIVHIPTGLQVVTQSHRSQLKNKEVALMKLKSLLYQEQLGKQVSFTSKLRSNQMGARLRNEKIRTYNYHQNRVTDHRIPHSTIYNLKEFMENGAFLDMLQSKLHEDMQDRILLEIVEKIESELR